MTAVVILVAAVALVAGARAQMNRACRRSRAEGLRQAVEAAGGVQVHPSEDAHIAHEPLFGSLWLARFPGPPIALWRGAVFAAGLVLVPSAALVALELAL
jgi:hypothetical protein